MKNMYKFKLLSYQRHVCHKIHNVELIVRNTNNKPTHYFNNNDEKLTQAKVHC